jgi:hypothetical protein
MPMSKSGLVGHISRFVVAIGIKKLMLVHGVLKLALQGRLGDLAAQNRELRRW